MEPTKPATLQLEPRSKRPYTTPTLTMYGHAAYLTRALGPQGHDDGGGDKTRL